MQTKKNVNWLVRSELNSCADKRYIKNAKVILDALPTDTMSLVSAFKFHSVHGYSIFNILLFLNKKCPWLVH